MNLILTIQNQFDFSRHLNIKNPERVQSVILLIMKNV